jgi:hypothetical protein
MRLTPKQLFLLDSAGGLFSAFLLGIVLAGNETTFGMPQNVVYVLACIACVYAFYSFLSYLKIKTDWIPYLKGIAMANLLYCCLTTGLVIYHRSALTIWGMSYFLLEVGIIISLAVMELITASKLSGERI